MSQRKPSAVREAEGNPGKRPLPKNEPAPARGAPKVPTWLPADARKHWRQLLPILDEMHVLTMADGLALGLLCNELLVYLEADEHVQNGELVQTCDSGYEQQTPWVTIRSSSLKQIRAMLASFGLTPADRTKVEALKDEAGDNPLAKVLEMTKRAPDRRRKT